MSRNKLVLCLVSIAFFLTACSEKTATTVVEEKETVVETTTVKSEVYPQYISYLGNVETKDTFNYGFKSGGKVASISVEKGQFVEEGQELARLDISDYQFAVDAALGQYNATKAQYEKAVNGATAEEVRQVEISVEQAKILVEQAKSASEFTNDLFEKHQILFEEGLVSQNQLDQIELEKNVKEQDLLNATEQLKKAEEGLKQITKGARAEDIEALRGQLQQAEANLNVNKKMLEDTTLYADLSGYVVAVPVSKGEMVGAGYPVVVVRTPNKVVKTGITAKDIGLIQKDTPVKVTYEHKVYDGKVSFVEEVPNLQTRTYQAEILLDDEANLPLGAVVNVQFVTGEQHAMMIPISIILNDGESDYIFVMNEENRAAQKTVEILTNEGEMAVVNGLNENDKVVTKGFKGIRPGDLLALVEQSDLEEVQENNESIEEEGVNKDE